MRTDADLEQTIELYGDTVWRICMLHFPTGNDADDVFQTTMLKYATSDVDFVDETHRKAWLIRVTLNACNDAHRAQARNAIPLERIDDTAEIIGITAIDANEGSDDAERVHKAMEELPPDYRETLYLTYFEGYPATAISEMTGKPVNTIYTHLSRGRKLLKEVLERER